MTNRTNLIFTHKLITAFADSLVKVFIPLIILKGTGDMMLTMIYLCVYYILCAFFNVVLKKFLQKYGIVAIVLHAIPLIALQFVLTMQIDIFVCLIVALLASLGQVLYSVPLNLLFTFTDKDVNNNKDRHRYVYFDEITGELRALVTLKILNNPKRLQLYNIQYY